MTLFAMLEASTPGVSSMADPQAAARRARAVSFVLNGRFFAQGVTGVQRYGREITRALDLALAASNRRGVIALPARAAPDVELTNFAPRVVAPLSGHFWEQGVLPLRCGERLLGLCNLGPVAKRDQIVCLHDANVFCEPDSYHWAFRLAYRSLLPLLAHRAARVTTVSKASASLLAAHLPIRAAAIAVLPNGHEHVRRWNAAASTLAPRLRDARPFVLLLGSRSRHKNMALILDLAEAVDGLGLDIIVAGGPAGIFTQLETRASHNVFPLGVVSDDDLALLYSRAMCLAFPSFTEGFGLPLVEAMALGCPVVSSDRASMPEVCGAAALYAAPDNGAAWLAHFKALMASPRLREDLQERGRRQVTKFSWAESAQGYLALLGEE